MTTEQPAQVQPGTEPTQDMTAQEVCPVLEEDTGSLLTSASPSGPSGQGQQHEGLGGTGGPEAGIWGRCRGASDALRASETLAACP